MKAKYILLLAAMAFGFVLTGCKEDVPYDTQSPDDQPLILRPYNESGTGSFTYDLANPDMPLYDSVTVTPSRYTTVNWYLDGELIFSGNEDQYVLPCRPLCAADRGSHRNGQTYGAYRLRDRTSV